MDDERLDLDELAPWQGSAFDVAVHRVLRGVQQLERPSLESVLVRQGRAAMAFVALCAVVAWIPAFVRRDPTPMPHDAVELVSHWATTNEVPKDVDLSRVVGAFR